MKKSIVRVISVLSLMALLVTGCSSNSNKNDYGTNAPVNTEGQKTDGNTVNNSPATNATTDNTTQTTKDAEEPVVTQEAVPVSTTPTVEEKVLYEDKGVKITLKGLEMDGMMGPELKFLVENDSDKSLMVQANDVSVNGYMVSTSMSVDVKQGKKANDKLRFLNSSLEMTGITTFADIELRFHFINSEDWTDYYDSDMIKIETSAAKDFDYTYDESGSSMYKSDDINVIFKGMSADASYVGPCMIVYINNQSEQDIMVQVRDASVNGFMVGTVFSCEVPKGKHAVDKIVFLDKDLEENGITQFDNIELSLHISDKKTWKTIIDTEPIKATFNR